MTVYCVRCRFFGNLRKWLVSAFAEITFVLGWTLLYWKLKLEVEWNGLINFLIACLILVALTGTYENSLFIGRNVVTFETCNPAFGGRGPGFLRPTSGTWSQLAFDSTCGFPGEGWSSKFPQFKVDTWNCRSRTCPILSFPRIRRAGTHGAVAQPNQISDKGQVPYSS